MVARVSVDALIGDAAGVFGIFGALFGWHASRLKRERARADRWEAVATEMDRANDDLRDQVRDLRTVALIDERLDARLHRGGTSVE